MEGRSFQGLDREMNNKYLMGIGGLLLGMAMALHSSEVDFPKLTGPYLGQKPPGMTPEVFAPGIISVPESNEFCASFSPDGTEFYFNRGMKIMVCSLKDRRWSSPEPALFSSGFPAHEAHITFDGKRIFWGWFREGGYGIYYSNRVSKGWSEAKSAGMEGKGFCLTSDLGGELFITKNGPGVPPVIARVVWKDGVFADMVPIEGEINATVGVVNAKGFRNMSHPAVSPDGSYILFDCNGGSHLWVTFRQADGTWSMAVDLSQHGIGKEFGIATVSQDGKYVFLSGNNDIYWVSAKIIEELRPKEARKGASK
jgi:hypothetical protein